MGWGIALIGLISGLVTGLSPCILPVLLIVLAVSADKRRKPWLVATDIGLSFTLGTLALTALGGRGAAGARRREYAVARAG